MNDEGMSSTPSVTTAAGDCRAVLALLTRLPDGALSSSEQSRLEAHLERCPTCHREAALAGRIARALRQEPSPEQVLPSGSRVATWVLEREAARPRPAIWLPGLSLAGAALLVVAWLGSGSGEKPVPAAPPTPPAISTVPALIVVDDDRTGRQVLLGPANPAQAAQ